MKIFLAVILFLFSFTLFAGELPEVSAPYQDMDTVIRDFERIKNYFEARDDNRFIFATIYLKTTTYFKKAIQEGAIDHPQWLEKVICNFADLYIEALTNYENGRRWIVPGPWLKSFDVAVEKAAKPSVQLLLGMNAHINHDLAIAIDRSLGPEESLGKYEADYFKMNKMFKKLLPAFFKFVAKVAKKDPKKLFKKTKRKLIYSYVKKIRKRSWKAAEELHRFPINGHKNRIYRRLERRSSRIANFFFFSRGLIPNT